jgi:hypothetical protein
MIRIALPPSFWSFLNCITSAFFGQEMGPHFLPDEAHKKKQARLQACSFQPMGLLAAHGSLLGFDHLFHHVPTDVSSLSSRQITIVPLFQIHTDLIGDLILHVIESLTRLGNNLLIVAS